MLYHLRQRVILSLAFAALVYLALTLYADAPKLGQAFLQWDWRWLPLALGVTFVNYLVRFGRWHYYLHVVKITVPLWPSFLIFFAGFSLTMVPGKLGDLVKSFLLKSHYATPVSYSASVVVAERLTDTLAMVFLAAIGLSVYPLGLPAILFTTVVIALGILLVQSQPLANRLLDRMERAPVIGRFTPLARNLYRSTFLLLRWRPLAIALALAIVAWAGECIAFFFVLLGFALPATPDLLLQAIFIYAVASLFGAATFLPGGIGATEGSMTSLLQLLVQMNATIAAAATFLVRICTLWFAIVLGGIALFVFGFPREEAAAQATAASLASTDSSLRD